MLHRALALVALIATPGAHGHDSADAIARHCLPCHGASGTAPVKLDSPSAIARNRPLAELLVLDGTMPPALASASASIDSRALDARARAEVIAALRAGAQPAPASRAAPEGGIIRPNAAWTAPDSGGARLRTFVASSDARRIRGVRFANPGALSRSPIRFVSLVADPRGSLRRLDAADDEPGIESMGNAGNAPSGALGALSRVAPEFLLPDGFHFDIPAGDIAIETLCEPVGRPAAVLPELVLVPADDRPSRAVRALALPVFPLSIEPGECATTELRRSLPRAAEVVAVIVKGGAFLRTVSIEAGGARILEVADFRMAFNEPWILRTPHRVEPGASIVARFGFDNTRENPQQPSDPPKTVEAGLPPSGEDAMAVILYADAPASR